MTRNRFKITVSVGTDRTQTKTQVSARKRHIEQNLTPNVDLDLIPRNRLKIKVSLNTDRREIKTRVSDRKRQIDKNLT